MIVRDKTVQGRELSYGYYLVAVFDLLGQSRRLGDQVEIPLEDEPTEVTEAIKRLSETAGAVLGFRKLFQDFFELPAFGDTESRSLHGARQKGKRPVAPDRRVKIMCWGVSDTIFLALPLASKELGLAAHVSAMVFV